ncbi:MAG: GlxA family transcriptional regulator [Candidatus Competibacteraceae bacterium]|nr:GlxA family transcriptional regulator [Candidatus Competibacteraceae bacterium]
MDTAYHIGFLLLPRFSLMAFASASEPLRVANRVSGKTLYRWYLLSEQGEPVPSSNGMVSMVQHSVASATKPALVAVDIPRLDMLTVIAGFEPERAVTPTLLAWLKRQAGAGVLLGGVDTGPYALARAGLLNGYQATVHWEYLAAFQQQFPRVLASQAMFITDRKRFSAAGGTACLDMMLHLIRTQHGQTLAAAVADQFVYGRMRSGSDNQRLSLSQRLPPAHQGVIQAITLMEQHLEDTLSTAQLAAGAGLSLRELERLFKRWLQTTPGAYYRRLRLEQARSLLQQSGLSVTDIANQCGFSSLAGFSRAYRAQFGQAPSENRPLPVLSQTRYRPF